MQCLQQEKEKLQRDMEQVYKLQKEELEIQQLQHFQVKKLHEGPKIIILFSRFFFSKCDVKYQQISEESPVQTLLLNEFIECDR